MKISILLLSLFSASVFAEQVPVYSCTLDVYKASEGGYKLLNTRALEISTRDMRTTTSYPPGDATDPFLITGDKKGLVLAYTGESSKRHGKPSEMSVKIYERTFDYMKLKEDKESYYFSSTIVKDEEIAEIKVKGTQSIYSHAVSGSTEPVAEARSKYGFKLTCFDN